VLELPLDFGLWASDRIMSMQFSNLRTLILNEPAVTDETAASQFWENHKSIERIEIGRRPAEFLHLSPGCLPNLRTLKVRVLLVLLFGAKPHPPNSARSPLRKQSFLMYTPSLST
jgi:hypothetical protein